jgi:two-component system, NtrC family, sensor histidine kinase HydH
VSPEARLDVLTRLADDLAHEIKNPLHAAVINLEVLRRRVSRLEGGGDAVRIAEIVGGELERVGRRVELLLRLTRPDAGRAARVESVVDEVTEILGLVATHRRIAFTHQGSEGVRAVSRPAGELRHRLLAAALEVMEREGVRSVALHLRGEPEAPEAVLIGTDAAGGTVGEAVELDLLDPGRAAGLSS